jgi:lipopolysaccharide export LptBFGC system permease protein LptF
MLLNEFKSARVSSNLRRVWSSKRFSIDRRRNLKSRIQNNLKETIQLKRVKNETKLLNDVIVFENDKKVAFKIYQVVSAFHVWKEHDTSVIISSEDHMSIELKSDWVDKIKSNKIYSLRSNERAIVDETFDN